jgi:DNA-directed RNA polymerase subunit RPC12/RpoP
MGSPGNPGKRYFESDRTAIRLNSTIFLCSGRGIGFSSVFIQQADMATIKVACPKCGQKVSGDESFFGSTVECPICSSDIFFPGQKRPQAGGGFPHPVPPEPRAEEPVSTRLDLDTTSDAAIRSLPREELPIDDERPPVGSQPSGTPATTAEEDDEPALPPSPLWGSISIVSAVLGVVTCVGGILFAPIAIIFGHTALAKARHSPVQPAPGHTLGAIGLMIGYVSLVITILVLLIATFFSDAIREAIQNARE